MGNKNKLCPTCHETNPPSGHECYPYLRLRADRQRDPIHGAKMQAVCKHCGYDYRMHRLDLACPKDNIYNFGETKFEEDV